MIQSPRRLAAILFCAAALLPAGAEAQYYGGASARPAPLYPYELQPGQPYAVEVAPNTYRIHRPAPARGYPYVNCVNGCAQPERRAAPAPKRFDRPLKRNDPALIQELRKRHAKKTAKPDAAAGLKPEIVNTTKIVRLPPVVVERRRVVEHPPNVIERYQYEDGSPAPTPAPRRKQAQIEERGVLPPAAKKSRKDGADEKRVIRAEAEVTILGPDRMSIRLFRKGEGGPNASAAGAR